MRESAFNQAKLGGTVINFKIFRQEYEKFIEL